MVGLSISLCIRDIAAGKVDIATVDKIFGGTATGIPSPSSIDALARNYKLVYWKDNPAKAEAIFRRLVAEGKIEEPRLKNNLHRPYLGQGHWVEREDSIPWADKPKKTIT